MFKLNPPQFAAVFDRLRALGEVRGIEKRDCTRMQVQAQVTLCVLQGDKVIRAHTALTRDISVSGAGILQFAPAEPETVVAIALPTNNRDIVVLSTVRHCRALAEGVFGVGLQFGGLASEAVIAAMAASDRDAVDRTRQSILD